MPMYDFHCLSCKHEFEELAPYDEKNKYKSVICPKCGSKKKKRLANSCSHNFTNPVGTNRWTSDAGGHGYRFEYNLPNVAKEREYATQNSHMGTNVYDHIDDISSGEHEGKDLLKDL